MMPQFDTNEQKLFIAAVCNLLIKPNAHSQLNKDLQSHLGQQVLGNPDFFDRANGSLSQITSKLAEEIYGDSSKMERFYNTLAHLDLNPRFKRQLEEFKSSFMRSELTRSKESLEQEKSSELAKSAKRKIHFITSQKGGGGKTVLSMCIWHFYFKSEIKLLIIDINFMNTDTFHIFNRLEGFKRLENSLQSQVVLGKIGEAGFDGYTLHNDNVIVLRLVDPDRLPLGVRAVWENIISLQAALPDYDLLIDTNLQLANMIISTPFPIENEATEYIEPPLDKTGERELRPKVKDFLGKSQNTVFLFYFIWSYSGIRHNSDKQIIAEQEFRDIENIKYIHVINPVTIIKPVNDFVALINSLHELKASVDFLRTGLKKSTLSPADKTLIGAYMDKIEEIQNNALNNINPLPFTELGDWATRKKTPYISISKFVEKMRNVVIKIQTYTDDNQQDSIENQQDSLSYNLKSLYNEFSVPEIRPVNVLIITAMVSSLRGYVEKTTIDGEKDVAKIHKALGAVGTDVKEFLEHLDSWV